MLKQSLDYNFNNLNFFIERDISPSNLLMWSKRGISIIPIAAKISNNYFLLSDFESKSKTYNVIEVNTLYEALMISLHFYDITTITPSEIVNLYRICDDNGLSFDNLPMPKALKTNGYNIEYLENSLGWPETLVNYLNHKEINWNTFKILTLLNRMQINYVNDILYNHKLSAQEFKKLVEYIRDYSGSSVLELSQYPFKDLNTALSPLHIKINSLIQSVNSEIHPVKVSNKNDMETPELVWEFSTFSYKDFIYVLKILSLQKNNIEKLYKLI